MKLMTKLMVGTAALIAIVALPAVFRADGWASPTGLARAVTYQAKNESRLPEGNRPADAAGGPRQLAQAPDQPLWQPLPGGPEQLSFRLPFGFPPAPPAPLDPRAAALPFMGPPGPPPPPADRETCAEMLAHGAAMVAYLESKLRLQPSQKDAWQKVEQASAPAIQQLRALCDKRPAEARVPPALPDAIDLAEQEAAARLDLLRAVREPLLALYNSLTPEQRNALQPPAPPAPRPL
jgi:hypothetical protein